MLHFSSGVLLETMLLSFSFIESKDSMQRSSATDILAHATRIS